MGCPLAVADRIYLEQARGYIWRVREEESAMNNGTIKKLVSDPGFGFIAAQDRRPQ